MRNQARVHLWYPEKHSLPYPPLAGSTEGIDRFLTKNTQVGIRRNADGYDVYAPNGFDDIEGLIVRPNPGPNFSPANYAAKAARWKSLWPELTVLPAEVVDVRNISSLRRAGTPSMTRWARNAVWVPTFRTEFYRTTPEINPALRRGGLISFFRKQCASLPT